MTIIYLYDVISSTAITLWDFHKVKIKTKKVSLEFLSIRLNQVDSFLINMFALIPDFKTF